MDGKMMEPTQELVDALYREKVLQERKMSPGEKLFAGAELFDLASQVTLAGIRAQFPGIDEQGALRILRERLALARRLEDET
jgi:hypothetical protein